MKKGLSWGWKIALLYSGFVIMMLVLVAMSVSQKIDLVSDDYYAMELIHQQKIDKIKRANELQEPVKLNLNNDFVEITFPKNFESDRIEGNIIFYCPSDSEKDMTLPIVVDGGSVQRIAKGNIQPGRYHLQVDWSANGVTYWDESVMNISK